MPRLNGTIFKFFYLSQPNGAIRLTQQRCGCKKAGPGFYPFTPEDKRVKTFAHGYILVTSLAQTLAMTAFTETKTCLACGKQLKGRIDKKFCDDYCRNNYNNQQKAKGNYSSYVRNINNTLLKNRKILDSVLPETEETAKANKEKLQRLGFQFKYLTHIYTTKTGKTYFYCYDYGYLPLENDWFLIVRRKEE